MQKESRCITVPLSLSQLSSEKNNRYQRAKQLIDNDYFISFEGIIATDMKEWTWVKAD
ncbi:MAG: hypothetical protein Q4A76_01545 [Porphyromonadaceae bacterium]|nr:hypothetical protein [Porphyromonadaceae bacterium]